MHTQWLPYGGTMCPLDCDAVYDAVHVCQAQLKTDLSANVLLLQSLCIRAYMMLHVHGRT